MASGGVPKVTELALPAIAKASVLLCTSKGFWTDPDGRIQLLPDAGGQGHDHPALPGCRQQQTKILVVQPRLDPGEIEMLQRAIDKARGEA